MRFSILTPSYNYARFLPDALESVARQEGVDVEHIVVDDGSTDNSVDVLRAWPHPLVLEVQENKGLSRTLNHALELATGDIIGWLNADDFYLPGALATAAEAFGRNDVDVVFGDSIFIDADARVLRLAPQHRMCAQVLRWYESFVAPCASFRRRCALPAPAWDDRMRVLMDWDQDLRMLAAERRYVHVRQTLGAFRRHALQQSALTHPGDAAEKELLVARHGLPLSGHRRQAAASAGHLLHASLKAAAGSYRRQQAARSLRGCDARWWQSDEGAHTAAALGAGPSQSK